MSNVYSPKCTLISQHLVQTRSSFVLHYPWARLDNIGQYPSLRSSVDSCSPSALALAPHVKSKGPLEG